MLIPEKLDAPHVGHVEHAGIPAYCGHLSQNACRILDRHVPPAKRGHATTGRRVQSVEWGLLEAFGCHAYMKTPGREKKTDWPTRMWTNAFSRILHARYLFRHGGSGSANWEFSTDSF